MYLIIIVAILFFIIWFFFFRKQKPLDYGCLLYITGALKTGKTFLSMSVIDLEYKKVISKWKKSNFKRKIISILKHCDYVPIDKPLIYSNMPLNIPYVPLTNELLLRKERFVKGSIVYLNEASFVASQMDTKDDLVNFQLNSFCKLFGHEVGSSELGYDGLLILDTQNIKDTHYAFKNVCTSFYFIHHKKSFLHFWIKLYLKEYSYVDNVSNNTDTDLADDFKIVIRSKKYFKYYDRYAYSSFTDYLSVNDHIVYPLFANDLKMKQVVSFNERNRLFLFVPKKNNINKNINIKLEKK